MNLHHREKIKAWPVSREPIPCSQGTLRWFEVRMSDGTARTFRHAGEAIRFIKETPQPPTAEAWPVSEPRYGYATSEWMVSLSDGSVERFTSRFDALCFVNDHGAPDLKAQLAASLRETSERAEYHFEEQDNERTFEEAE